MRGLILSLFPGLDLLGRAFEAHDWCVVRGPDVLWAQDIRDWHPPAGRFDGVIGGPPCQMFSPLANIARAQGYEIRFGNLVPEFERVVAEAEPSWWLMEQVRGAPMPSIERYKAESTMLSPQDLGDSQSRPRRITVGTRSGIMLTDRLPFMVPESPDKTPAVTSAGEKWENRAGYGHIGGSGRTWSLAARSSKAQGYPGLADELRKMRIWTADGVCQAIANGVPRVMGEAIAKAISEWWDEK